MSKLVRKRLLQTIELLRQGTQAVGKLMEEGRIEECLSLLGDCQDLAIAFGTRVEAIHGMGTATVSALEGYCEGIYQVGECMQAKGTISDMKSAEYAALCDKLAQVQKSFETEFPDKREVVFFPYKASMWDSLESVWRAARDDEECEVYVVPIPYYDLNTDGSIKACHYEGDLFPEDVSVTRYEDYDLKLHHPDIAYIHNPYDDANRVTSVDPKYYSAEIKKHTDCLIYIPYYATSGGMAEGQALCPAYLNADYIVIQAEKYKKFFDPSIPDEKFLAYGSPKFDKVIRLCKNPPEPPLEWKARMEGKKVYFYNTSIGGMLADTVRFLQKMEYVFQSFQGRTDACLLWRPHPLLESTFESMRMQYKPQYDNLKKFFLENNLGIYDDTPDITSTIAQCDAYIGDAGTSVTSLFGIAGKPLFIFNNNIHTLPLEDDWRGEIIRGANADGNDDWMITQGNKLYHAPNHDYHYKFYCDLSEYTSGNYFCRAIEVNGKVYVCPRNAQELLVVADGRVIRRIPLPRRVEQSGAFTGAWSAGPYIFLIPIKYPAIVRYDTERDQLDYVEGYNSVFVQNVRGTWKIGGCCIWKDYLFLSSPTDSRILGVNVNTLQVQQLTTGAGHQGGCSLILKNGDELWILPYEGTVITKWNPQNGTHKDYTGVPEGFCCKNRPHGFVCGERPFDRAAFGDNKVIFPPNWGNMFVCLDKDTGKFSQWTPPFDFPEEEKNGYYNTWTRGYFVRRTDTLGEDTWRFFSVADAQLYDVNLRTGDYVTIPIIFDKKELEAQASGFGEVSEWLRYGMEENSFHSLRDFLDGTLVGSPFDRAAQIHAYSQIAANSDGTCGERVHAFACHKVQETED